MAVCQGLGMDEACEAGGLAACDRRFGLACAGSEYGSFDNSCGGRTDGSVFCAR